ncbi:MAG: ABC transporter permease [Deferrisomatales bacterium]
MRGLGALYRKELSDHLSSYRFLLLFALIAMVSLTTVYAAGIHLVRELEGAARPRHVFLLLFTASGFGVSLTQFVALFGPLVGLVLGFDAVNRERNEGTLSKLLAQPIHRDAVINGKFLAGLTVIAVLVVSILGLVTGLGLIAVGATPGPEELCRVAVYAAVSILYIAFWLGVALLFSILFRSVATSALAGVATWLFFSFFLTLAAGAVASAAAPEAGDPEALVSRIQVERAVSLLSPLELYSHATAALIDPMRRTTRSVVTLGMLEQLSLSRFSGPLPLADSVLMVMPYLVALLALASVCFAVSYAVFLRQEIRSV